MKIAFTTKTGALIDLHFGQAEAFHVWEVGPDEAHYLETVNVASHGTDEEDKIEARTSLIADCAVVYTMQIGGPAAAKLIAKRIHPMKTNVEVGVQESIERIQEVLRGNPPPWLRKAMHKSQAGSFLDED
jgi:nitrogen fixation protein NifX